MKKESSLFQPSMTFDVTYPTSDKKASLIENTKFFKFFSLINNYSKEHKNKVLINWNSSLFFLSPIGFETKAYGKGKTKLSCTFFLIENENTFPNKIENLNYSAIGIENIEEKSDEEVRKVNIANFLLFLTYVAENKIEKTNNIFSFFSKFEVESKEYDNTVIHPDNNSLSKDVLYRILSEIEISLSNQPSEKFRKRLEQIRSFFGSGIAQKMEFFSLKIEVESEHAYINDKSEDSAKYIDNFLLSMDNLFHFAFFNFLSCSAIYSGYLSDVNRRIGTDIIHLTDVSDFSNYVVTEQKNKKDFLFFSSNAISDLLDFRKFTYNEVDVLKFIPMFSIFNNEVYQFIGEKNKKNKLLFLFFVLLFNHKKHKNNDSTRYILNEEEEFFSGFFDLNKEEHRELITQNFSIYVSPNDCKKIVDKVKVFIAKQLYYEGGSQENMEKFLYFKCFYLFQKVIFFMKEKYNLGSADDLYSVFDDMLKYNSLFYDKNIIKNNWWRSNLNSYMPITNKTYSPDERFFTLINPRNEQEINISFEKEKFSFDTINTICKKDVSLVGEEIKSFCFCELTKQYMDSKLKQKNDNFFLECLKMLSGGGDTTKKRNVYDFLSSMKLGSEQNKREMCYCIFPTANAFGLRANTQKTIKETTIMDFLPSFSKPENGSFFVNCDYDDNVEERELFEFNAKKNNASFIREIIKVYTAHKYMIFSNTSLPINFMPMIPGNSLSFYPSKEKMFHCSMIASLNEENKIAFDNYCNQIKEMLHLEVKNNFAVKNTDKPYDTNFRAKNEDVFTELSKSIFFSFIGFYQFFPSYIKPFTFIEPEDIPNFNFNDVMSAFADFNLFFSSQNIIPDNVSCLSEFKENNNLIYFFFNFHKFIDIIYLNEENISRTLRENDSNYTPNLTYNKTFLFNMIQNVIFPSKQLIQNLNILKIIHQHDSIGSVFSNNISNIFTSSSFLNKNIQKSTSLDKELLSSDDSSSSNDSNYMNIIHPYPSDFSGYRLYKGFITELENRHMADTEKSAFWQHSNITGFSFLYNAIPESSDGFGSLDFCKPALIICDLVLSVIFFDKTKEKVFYLDNKSLIEKEKTKFMSLIVSGEDKHFPEFVKKIYKNKDQFPNYRYSSTSFQKETLSRMQSVFEYINIDRENIGISLPQYQIKEHSVGTHMNIESSIIALSILFNIRIDEMESLVSMFLAGYNLFLNGDTSMNDKSFIMGKISSCFQPSILNLFSRLFSDAIFLPHGSSTSNNPSKHFSYNIFDNFAGRNNFLNIAFSSCRTIVKTENKSTEDLNGDIVI